MRAGPKWLQYKFLFLGQERGDVKLNFKLEMEVFVTALTRAIRTDGFKYTPVFQTPIRKSSWTSASGKQPAVQGHVSLPYRCSLKLIDRVQHNIYET